MSVVDARGLSCPEPVLVTKRNLEKTEDSYIKVLVDEMAACENVTALANTLGWKVSRENMGSHIELTLQR